MGLPSLLLQVIVGVGKSYIKLQFKMLSLPAIMILGVMECTSGGPKCDQKIILLTYLLQAQHNSDTLKPYVVVVYMSEAKFLHF